MNSTETQVAETLSVDFVKGWRLSALDGMGRRIYSSPVVPEPITVTISHVIAAGSALGTDETVGGRLLVQGSELLAPHITDGHIGLEVWEQTEDKEYPLRWWLFPSVLHGQLLESDTWGNGPDDEWLLPANSMWQFVPAKARPEFPALLATLE